MKRKLVSFDWAMKKLLRNKANFEILEGFLSELLEDEIKIIELLDSETNKQNALDKSSRVDLLVKNQRDELIIIEVQYEYESDYFHRALYNVSKIIIEHMQQGMSYASVRRVISVNIVYFDLGQGKDYIYQGTNNFIGRYEKDQLLLTEDQRERYKLDEVHQIFPEYYFLKVNRFNDIAKNTLDEWIYFLKNSEIKREFTAKGLQKAGKELSIMKLSSEDQKIFEQYLEDLRYQASIFESSYGEGEIKGFKKGKEEGEKTGIEKGKIEGRLEEKRDIARKLKVQGMAIDAVAAISGLSVEEVVAL